LRERDQRQQGRHPTEKIIDRHAHQNPSPPDSVLRASTRTRISTTAHLGTRDLPCRSNESGGGCVMPTLVRVAFSTRPLQRQETAYYAARPTLDKFIYAAPMTNSLQRDDQCARNQERLQSEATRGYRLHQRDGGRDDARSSPRSLFGLILDERVAALLPSRQVPANRDTSIYGSVIRPRAHPHSLRHCSHRPLLLGS
jgi:hypothetical protein